MNFFPFQSEKKISQRLPFVYKAQVQNLASKNPHDLALFTL